MEIIIGLLIFVVCILIAIVWLLQIKLDRVEWDIGLAESQHKYLENRINIIEKKLPKLFTKSKQEK